MLRTPAPLNSDVRRRNLPFMLINLLENRIWQSRLAAAVALCCGIRLHSYQSQLYLAMPFPREFLEPPVLWWMAPYLIALALAFTRHHTVGSIFAISTLALDLLAHYQVYVKPHIHSRFELTGLSLYMMPALSLVVVCPLIAFIVWAINRRAARSRASTQPE